MATNTRKLASLLGASGAGIADDGTLTSTAIGEVIVASDIATGAVGSSEIATGAVGSSEIATGAVTATELADNAVDAGAIAADAIPVKPHIQPGTLCPAVAGKLLDGTTSHSGAYGTAQSDGKSYYYTDIKGSKPIKDPRIGSHFGSQRHMFKSAQILEQETATHGQEVHSIDGREWLRIVGTPTIQNDSYGINVRPEGVATAFFEITGYFNAFNFLNQTSDSSRTFKIKLDGIQAHAAFNPNGSVDSPLRGRFVSAPSVFNIPLTATGTDLSSDTTLGIHTIQFWWVAGSNYPMGIELIAQDTTSATTRSQIQIPSQNVVSYGKKFTVSGTPHYNPFATKGDGSASTIPNDTTGDSVATGWTGSTSAYWDSSLDTATSLGLGAWESGGNFYRPVNGGRVVKWVDSSGTIKTSVNMMPPEAHAIEGASVGDSPATGTHNWSTQYLPQFGNKITGSDLITNGTFTSATTGWTAEGNTTIASTAGGQSGNCLTITRGTSATQTVKQTYASFVVGKWYKMSAYIKEGTDTGGTMHLRAEGAVATHYPNSPTFTSTGSFVKHSLVFKAETTSYEVMLRGTVDTDGQTILIDTVTLHEIEQPEAQAEVAKTFNWREFGNGAANGGTGAAYADASMVQASNDDIAYVMDDGLTSLSADDWQAHISGTHNGALLAGATTPCYITFIGTGISINFSQPADTRKVIAQNLPYGTHILKILYDTGGSNDLIIDGVNVQNNGGDEYVRIKNDITFHQPKMPPIPEDAVVLADYMLNADFVGQGADGIEKISKGVRFVSSSRDAFTDATSGSIAFAQSIPHLGGWRTQFASGGHAGDTVSIPAFGTNALIHSSDTSARYKSYRVDGGGSLTTTKVGSGYGVYYPANQTLGNHKFETYGTNSANFNYSGMSIVSPIHTSSHYQSFETPFLHELVGGDRNMEQTNLVVTPDGKTWDEVTRDVSYMGKLSLVANSEVGQTAESAVVVFDTHRGLDAGGGTSHKHYFNKDFAIGYDRFICLRAGEYRIDLATRAHSSSGDGSSITMNGILVNRVSNDQAAWIMLSNSCIVHMKRGDYIQIKGGRWYNNETNNSNFYITRID